MRLVILLHGRRMTDVALKGPSRPSGVSKKIYLDGGGHGRFVRKVDDLRGNRLPAVPATSVKQKSKQTIPLQPADNLQLARNSSRLGITHAGKSVCRMDVREP